MKFLEGYNVFVSLPTGGRKSLCFACLNALMHDEVTKFCSLGMTAVQVGTECSPTVTERVTSGGVQLVFMSSETI